MTRSIHRDLKQRQEQLQKQKVEKMQLQKQKVDQWKQKITKQYATRQRTKLEKIKILPWNTKRKITAADKVIAEAICPINQRLYYVIWSLR